MLNIRHKNAIFGLNGISFAEIFEFKPSNKTRVNHHKYTLYTKLSRINCYKYSFFVRVAQPWNAFPWGRGLKKDLARKTLRFECRLELLHIPFDEET